MRGTSAACYVEKPRLGASGVKNDRRISGPNRAEIRSKSGPNQVRGEGGSEGSDPEG